MTASIQPTAARLNLHPRTAEAIRTRQWETAAQLHCLAGIREWDPEWLDRHVLPDGRPQWDSLTGLPLSDGEDVLRDAAWELGGHRPNHAGVIVRASLLDEGNYRRLIEALGIRRQMKVTVAVPSMFEEVLP